MWGPGAIALETGREFPAGLHQQGWSVWEKEEVNPALRQGRVTPRGVEVSRASGGTRGASPFAGHPGSSLAGMSGWHCL